MRVIESGMRWNEVNELGREVCLGGVVGSGLRGVLIRSVSKLSGALNK